MRLAQEARREDPELSLNAAVTRVGQRTGVNADTLRGWMKQAAIDAGERPGTTTVDAVTIKQLETENRELKRANEILYEDVSQRRGSRSASARLRPADARSLLAECEH